MDYLNLKSYSAIIIHYGVCYHPLQKKKKPHKFYLPNGIGYVNSYHVRASVKVKSHTVWLKYAC